MLLVVCTYGGTGDLGTVKKCNGDLALPRAASPQCHRYPYMTKRCDALRQGGVPWFRNPVLTMVHCMEHL
jgi:hypothetical protein